MARKKKIVDLESLSPEEVDQLKKDLQKDVKKMMLKVNKTLSKYGYAMFIESRIIPISAITEELQENG